MSRGISKPRDVSVMVSCLLISCRALIKSFFTASQIFSVLKQFGELSEEVSGVRGGGGGADHGAWGPLIHIGGLGCWGLGETPQHGGGMVSPPGRTLPLPWSPREDLPPPLVPPLWLGQDHATNCAGGREDEVCQVEGGGDREMPQEWYRTNPRPTRRQ